MLGGLGGLGAFRGCEALVGIDLNWVGVFEGGAFEASIGLRRVQAAPSVCVLDGSCFRGAGVGEFMGGSAGLSVGRKHLLQAI